MHELELVKTPSGMFEITLEQDRELANFITYASEVAERLDFIKQTITEKMTELYLEEGVSKVEGKHLHIAFVPASTTDKFDSVKFKEDYPDLYKKYVKTSSRKASIRISFKDITEDDE